MKARWILLCATAACGYLLGMLTGCLRPTTQAPTPAPEVIRGQTPEAEPTPAAAFAFPQDRGGKLLAEVLPPADRPPARSSRLSARSRHAQPPRGLQHPDVAPVLGLPTLPRATLAHAPAVSRPRPLLDEPIPDVLLMRALPATPNVPVGRGIRVPSPDANQPVPLPPLAHAHPDRAPLDDPTVDAATAAALAGAPPMRTTPAPFLRLSVPDPFENRAAVRLQPAVPEEPKPPAATPQRPGK
jgi:hypothetical protein